MIPNFISFKFTKLACLLALLVFNISANAKHILVYGDSLSAAYGMSLEQGWVHLLDESVAEQYQVSNASISGETSAGGLERLPLTLEEFDPDLVIIFLGANDGLRGYSTETLESNLNAMIEILKERNITPVIFGVSIPQSYGFRYIDQFRAIFPKVANRQQISYLDLYREEFFSNEGYLQADGIHPSTITQPLIRDIVYQFLLDEELINLTTQQP